MRRYKLLATAAAVCALGTAPLSAQGKSGNAPKGGAPKTTSTAPVTHGNSAGVKNPNAGGPKASAPTTTASGAGTTTAPSTTTASAPKNNGNGMGAAKKNAPAPTTATTITTTPTPLPTAPNKVSIKLTGNPAQLAKVQTMLPPGMTLEQASAGFRNQGQFIAALNASKNRGLVFADLQKAMTVDGMSLGQAAKYVRTLPPVLAPIPTTGTTTPTAPAGTTTTSTTTTTQPKS